MRRTALFTVAAFASASIGCATSRQLPRPLTPAAVTQVQGALERRGAWVEHGLPGPPALIAAVERGRFRRVGADAAALELLSDDPPQAIPLQYVRSVQVNNHWLGGLEGAGLGFLSGAVIGVLLAPGGRSTCNSSDDNCLGLDFSGEILATSLLLGTLIGAAVGGAVGQRQTYRF
jgi:hypothetical protein